MFKYKHYTTIIQHILFELCLFNVCFQTFSELSVYTGFVINKRAEMKSHSQRMNHLPLYKG